MTNATRTINIRQIPLVYAINDGKIIEVKVDKIEVFHDYYRYVNEDPKVSINWWEPEQIDTDCFEENVANHGSSSFMVFTTREKAEKSKEFKRQLIAFYTRQKAVAEDRLYELSKTTIPTSQS